MPAFIAHFATLIETYHALRKGNESLFETEPAKKEELKETSAKLSKGKTDKGISQYAFLGSGFPDLPYYNENIAFAADCFHYNKVGTFAIKLIDYAKGKKKDDKSGDRLMAFTLGFISHIACDAICHPYINTIAGAYWNQLVPFIDKIDVPMLPIKHGKVHMHMMTETHQDSWLASNYFGLKNLSSEGASRSWSGFLDNLNLSVLIPPRKDEMNGLFEDIRKCFKEVYGKNMNQDDLWNAGNRVFEALDGSYDRALFPFPDYPSENLVNYIHRYQEYYFYLDKSFTLSKALTKKAIDYYKGGDREKEDLKKYLKDWNLDMGYCINISPKIENEKIVNINIRYEHSWCHNYGLYDM